MADYNCTRIESDGSMHAREHDGATTLYFLAKSPPAVERDEDGAPFVVRDEDTVWLTEEQADALDAMVEAQS